MTASPNMTLTMQHVPQHCRRARTILLGPLTPQDLNAASFINFKQGAPTHSEALHTLCPAMTCQLAAHLTWCTLVWLVGGALLPFKPVHAGVLSMAPHLWVWLP